MGSFNSEVVDDKSCDKLRVEESRLLRHFIACGSYFQHFAHLGGLKQKGSLAVACVYFAESM